jgi:hypothetical protein
VLAEKKSGSTSRLTDLYASIASRDLYYQGLRTWVVQQETVHMHIYFIIGHDDQSIPIVKGEEIIASHGWQEIC